MAVIGEPFILAFAIRQSVEETTDVLVAILENLPTMAMPKEVIEMAVVFRLWGFEDAIAVHNAHLPVAVIGQVLADEDSISMLEAIHVAALVGGEFGNFQPDAVPSIVGVLAVVPTPVRPHEEPIALPEIILQQALVERPALEKHDTCAMALPIELLPDVHLILVDALKGERFAALADQFCIVGAVSGYVAQRGTC